MAPPPGYRERDGGKCVEARRGERQRSSLSERDTQKSQVNKTLFLYMHLLVVVLDALKTTPALRPGYSGSDVRESEGHRGLQVDGHGGLQVGRQSVGTAGCTSRVTAGCRSVGTAGCRSRGTAGCNKVESLAPQRYQCARQAAVGSVVTVSGRGQDRGGRGRGGRTSERAGGQGRAGTRLRRVQR